MIHLIPTTSVSSRFIEAVSMDGIDFQLEFNWNARVSHWFVRLLDVEGNVLIGDVKIVADIPYLYHRRGEDLPPGELWCITTDKTDPGLNDLGTQAKFLYVDEEDVE